MVEPLKIFAKITVQKSLERYFINHFEIHEENIDNMKNKWIFVFFVQTIRS